MFARLQIVAYHVLRRSAVERSRYEQLLPRHLSQRSGQYHHIGGSVCQGFELERLRTTEGTLGQGRLYRVLPEPGELFATGMPD